MITLLSYELSMKKVVQKSLFHNCKRAWYQFREKKHKEIDTSSQTIIECGLSLLILNLTLLSY